MNIRKAPVADLALVLALIGCALSVIAAVRDGRLEALERSTSLFAPGARYLEQSAPPRKIPARPPVAAAGKQKGRATP